MAKLRREMARLRCEMAELWLQVVKFVRAFWDLRLANNDGCAIPSMVYGKLALIDVCDSRGRNNDLSPNSITCYAQNAVFKIPSHWHQKE